MVLCEHFGPVPCGKPAVQFVAPIEDIVDIIPPAGHCEQHRQDLAQPKSFWDKQELTEAEYHVAYVRYIMES